MDIKKSRAYGCFPYLPLDFSSSTSVINFRFRIPLAAAPRVSFLSGTVALAERRTRNLFGSSEFPQHPDGRHRTVCSTRLCLTPGCRRRRSRQIPVCPRITALKTQCISAQLVGVYAAFFNVATGIIAPFFAQNRRACARFRNTARYANFRAARACFTSSCFISVLISCFLIQHPFPVSPYFFFLFPSSPDQNASPSMATQIRTFRVRNVVLSMLFPLLISHHKKIRSGTDAAGPFADKECRRFHL